LALERDVPFLGRVPLAASVREGGDSGHPVVADDPDSAAGQAFRALAQAVAAQVSITLLANKQTIPLNVIK
jgi:ATP-binding protein involved in chromosome partitioning